MEGFLNLISLFRGWVFPYISRIHTAYIGEDETSILGTNEKFGDPKVQVLKVDYGRWKCPSKFQRGICWSS